ncbi:tricorn protease [Maribacter sedimenticola]|uniref:Tricorn protease homolog n=1 Tax=Maribacter sedimenticola TaxID=228956 RepID=A0ABY1SG42_9FLAO|nr:S41 family peptidase [Maribacter sedimenticola]SNR43954.1 tricorn protease [Maribacter sedimenticola]
MKKQFLLAATVLVVWGMAAQETLLLRQPTLSKNEVVFIYANDLWKAPVTGGDAIRLTSGMGYEYAPHYSPNEQWIAFTAEYEGNDDVYVIPATGGTPKRLTFHPSVDEVQGWTPNGEILFRSTRKARPTMTSQFYTVSLEGGLPKALEIPRGAYGEISEDGSHIAYTPITSWDPEWRNYRGGQAMPIWIVDLNTYELTTTPQLDQERHLYPVWIGKKVYYLSERDYTSNIWSYDTATQTEEQITFHKKFDVKSLDAAGNLLVYEQGGRLHILDIATKQAKTINISVKGDLNFSRSRWEEVTANNVINPNISPNGKRAVFEYRGDIFTFPKEEGSWRNLTQSSGVADRSPIWSPKGNKIAWFSDASGEYQLVVADQFGQNRKTYPLENPTFYFKPDWSPNGNLIAYTDTDYNIWTINLVTGKVNKVDTDRYAHPNRSMNPVWSPDSRWLTYEKQLDSHFKAVFIYDTQSGKAVQVTDGTADATSPVWDVAGEYLYFLASTDYGLASGWLDMSSYDPSITRSLYALVLSAQGKAPNLPKTDEEDIDEAKSDETKTSSKKDKKDKDEPKKTIKPVQIDFSGIQNRIVALDLPARDYQFLQAGSEKQVFVAEAIPNESGFKVHNYDVAKEKATDFENGVTDMVVSKNGEHSLLKSKSGWTITGTKDAPKPDDKIAVSAQLKIDPTAEYAQIFKESWRYMRDFLYVDNVHGAPWNEVYSWYQPWVKHVRHRTDLNYIVDILSGEVAIGHSYVSGGDMPKINEVPVGLLGADFNVVDGYYRIEKIYTGEKWNPNIRAPLAMPGLDVKEGDYIVAINGKPVAQNQNIYALLEQTADRTINISVNNSPSMNGSRSLTVKPVENEYQLRFIDWVEGNRRKVDELSGGKLAYVYIPNTSNPGFESFNKYYFSQQDKKGVILDERNNGGGSAADYMIDIMAREPFGYFNSKANDNRPWTSPIAGIWGPKVMIINERAGSGGDLLPYMFKEKGLGPLVGTRTWGGLVGTWDTPRFIDGGRMVAPRGGFYNNDGEWDVEGIGISPNIEVIQDPKSIVAGKDPQLERAVQEAMKLLETQEFIMKPEPAAPVRWKRPVGYENEN